MTFSTARQRGRRHGSLKARAMMAVVFLAALASRTAPAVTGDVPVSVIDLTGSAGHSRREIRALRHRVGHPVTVEPPERALVEAYRWASGDAARAGCDRLHRQVLDRIARDKWVVAPLGKAALFETLVCQAEEQLSFLDLQGVFDTADLVRSWAVCERDVVSHDLVVRFRLAEALAHVYRNDGRGVDAFVALLVVEPRFQLEAEFRSPKVDAAFDAATTAFADLSLVPAGRVPARSAVFVDGLELDRSWMYPGMHLIQIKARHGEVRTRWTEILGAASGHREAKFPDFGLLNLEQAYRRLVHDLTTRRIDRLAAIILDDYLAQRGRSEMFFLVLGPGDAPVLLRYAPLDGVRAWERKAPHTVVPVAREVPGQAKTSGGWQISGGVGVQGFTGGRDVFFSAPWNGGYAATLRRPGAWVDLELTAGVYPHALTAAAGQQGCVPGPTEIDFDVPAAAGCLAHRPTLAVSAGAAHTWRLSPGRRIRVSPGAHVDLLRVPDLVVVPDGQGDASSLVGDAVMGGGAAQLRLSYALIPSLSAPEIGVTGAFGVVTARAPSGAVLATLLMVTLTAGFPF